MISYDKLILDLSKKVREFIICSFGQSRNYCAISSCLLFDEFERNNIDCKIAVNKYHAFLIVNSNLLVDVTSDQFVGYEDVSQIVIANYDSLKQHYFWKNEWQFDSINDFVSHQNETHWPREQIINNNLFNDYLSYNKAA